MKKILLSLFALLLSASLFAQDMQTVAYFSFNGLNDSPQTVILADGGAQSNVATLYLDGSNGSSAWPSEALGRFNGSYENLLDGFERGYDLALQGPSSNQKSAVFKLSMASFQGLVLTYAFKRTQNGHTSCIWSYSTDGESFTDLPAASDQPYNSAIEYRTETVDMSGITALNEQATVYLRLYIDGCNNSNSSRIRLDNVTFSAYPGGDDVYPPHITEAQALNPSAISLRFNEELDTTTVANPANYVFEDGYTVSNATVNNENVVTVVINQTFTNGLPFTFSVRNVADVAGNVMEPDTFTLIYGVLDEFICADIATLRSKFDYTLSRTDTNWKDTVEYMVVSNMIVVATDPYRNQKILQDETGAILVYDEGNILGSLEPEDQISEIYGTLTNFYGFLEFVPTRPYGMYVDFWQTVDPLVITLEQLNDETFMIQHQAELIELENVSITSTGQYATPLTGNFAIKDRYEIQQGNVTAPALFPYFRSANYISQPIPVGVSQNIVGFNFSTTTLTGSGSGAGSDLPYRYYIVPRSLDDMSAMSSVQDYGKMRISVYPNPTTAFVTVNDVEATDVEIYDVNGKKVATQSMQHTNMVSLQGMSAGSYFLRLLKDGELAGTTKVIKR